MSMHTVKKNLKAGDVCVLVYDNLFAPRTVGSIVLVDTDYSNRYGDEVVVQISEKDYVYMIPQFLKKIGTL